MTIDEAEVDDFYREASAGGSVWTVDNGRGMPMAATSTGRRAVPFWSLASRAEAMTVDGGPYPEYSVREVPLAEWTSGWLPRLNEEGFLVGLNWAGQSASGFDAEPSVVIAHLAS